MCRHLDLETLQISCLEIGSSEYVRNSILEVEVMRMSIVEAILNKPFLIQPSQLPLKKRASLTLKLAWECICLRRDSESPSQTPPEAVSKRPLACLVADLGFVMVCAYSSLEMRS